MKIYRKIHSLALPLEKELTEKGHLDYENDENLWFGAYYLKDNILEEEAKDFEQRFPEMRPLASGNEGVVYDLGNDRTLKLTFNGAEYEIGSQLIGNPSPYFADVYEADILDDGFAIIMEKCKTMNTSEDFEEVGSRMDLEQEMNKLRNNVKKQFPEISTYEISTDNVGFDRHGNLVVIDFGLWEGL